MVNVEYSPALLLGVGFIAAGLGLYQLRVMRPWLSRDQDIVIFCVAVLSGGILVFQVSKWFPVSIFGLTLGLTQILKIHRDGGWTRCCSSASCLRRGWA